MSGEAAFKGSFAARLTRSGPAGGAVPEQKFNLIAYLPILLMFVVAAGFAVTNVLLSQMVGQRKRTRTKLMPYECGKDPVGSARERFSVKFYLIAMLFILFDIEAIFLIPWAVVFKGLGATSSAMNNLLFVEMMLFVVLLFVGYVYVVRKGAFDWSERARREAEAEAHALADMEQRQPTPTRRAA
ncbi:MAG TPA: NADH-quinone oxidoreductase subunit A [Pyrinomonadaceae bacterium]